MKAYRCWRKEDNARARDLFKKAYDIDPDWYLPLILIGWTHQQDARMGWSVSRKKSTEQASEIAQRVIAIYNKSPTAHLLIGSIHLYKREYEKELSLNPNAAYTQVSQGIVLTYTGKPQITRGAFQKSRSIHWSKKLTKKKDFSVGSIVLLYSSTAT